jgi:hypothetical protein
MSTYFSDIIKLVQVVIWPAVLLILFLVYRKELPRLIQAVVSRVTSLSAGVLTLQFIATEPPQEVQSRLDAIREPTSAGASASPSGERSLIELIHTGHPCDYLVIDQGSGKSWLTSRLYLFATVLPCLLQLKCLVFVGTRDLTPRYFYGTSTPEAVRRALEKKYPWLSQSLIEAQIEQLVFGQAPNQYVGWNPAYAESGKAALQAIRRGKDLEWDLSMAESLQSVIHDLIIPFDPDQQQKAEMVVSSFLNNPQIRRPLSAGEEDKDWVRFSEVEEHARWVSDEDELKRLLEGELNRECLVENATEEPRVVERAFLRKNGYFVAQVDSDGRFLRLIDRNALVEKVARS